MKLNLHAEFSRKFLLTTLVLADIIIAVIACLEFLNRKFIYEVLLFMFGPMLLLMTIMIIIEELARGHRAQFKRVAPSSSYQSIQHRAQEFLDLSVPYEMRGIENSFANKCIERHAKNGSASMTEKERTKLSLELVGTGITSQTSREKKDFFSRERVAILEDILSSKFDSI